MLCDSQWCDPDMDSSNGIQMGLRDMLRIDSMLMMVQLNIRVLLEVSNASHPCLLLTITAHMLTPLLLSASGLLW